MSGPSQPGVRHESNYIGQNVISIRSLLRNGNYGAAVNPALLTNIVFISHQHPPPAGSDIQHKLGGPHGFVERLLPGGQSLSII